MQQLQGHYGNAIASETFDTNEGIRLNWLYTGPVTNKEGETIGKRDNPVGRKKITMVTRADCQTWVDSITAKKRKGDHEWIEPASPSRKRRCAAFLSKLFSLAIDEGLIHENPMARVRLPKIQERKNRVLTAAEMNPILEGEKRIDALMITSALTSMRRKELQSLQWSHIDFDRKLIQAPGSKTDAAIRTIPLMDTLAAVLQKLPRKGSYVFCTDQGKPLSLRNINRDVNLRKEELGIPAETRLQDLRGTFISLLVDQGVGIRTVMELVGHRDPRTTLKAYARGYDASKQAVIANLETLIAPKKAEAQEANA